MGVRVDDQQDGRRLARSLPALLAAAARDHPGAEAVGGPDGRMTYAELGVTVGQLAQGFRAAGVRPGDRVGLMMSNGWRWIATALGAHAAGASVVAMSTFQRRHEIEYVVR